MIIPKNTYQTFKVAFGTSRTGKTVQYEILDNDGSVLESLTATGVVELGHGEYGVRRRFITNFEGYIRFKDVEDSLYASESITVVNDFISQINTVFKIETGRWRIDTSSNTLILYDDNGVDILYTFDLLDSNGDGSYSSPMERKPS